MFVSFLNKSKQIVIKNKRFIQILREQEYQEICGKSLQATEVEYTKLNNPYDESKKIYLIGIPKRIKNDNVIRQINEEITKQNSEKITNLIQLNPMNFLHLKRQILLKLDNPFFKSEIKRALISNPYKLLKWDEGYINYEELINLKKTLEMDPTQQAPNEEQPTNLNETLTEEQEKEIEQELHKLIQQYVINKNNIDNKNLIEILHKLLIHYEKTIMIDIPEHFHRILLGSQLDLASVKQFFKNVLVNLDQLSKLQKKLPTEHYIKLISYSTDPYFIFGVKDLYVMTTIKQFCQKAQEGIIYLDINCYYAVLKMWDSIQNPLYDFNKVNETPKKIEGETDEDLIEKHAILDVALNTKIWDSSLLDNKFIFLNRKLEGADEQEINELNKMYYVKYRKYRQMIDLLDESSKKG